MKRFLIAFICLCILFTGNHYAVASGILVYDPGSGDIQNALKKIYDPSFFTVCDSNTISNYNLQDYSVLVVGWTGSIWGDYSGLYNIGLETYITGNILLTGHDPDFHYNYSVDNYGNTYTDTGKTSIIGNFLQQAINFGRAASGRTGLVVFADWLGTYYDDDDYDNDYIPYNWLPQSYNILATETADLNSDTITTITADGIASGVYNNLSEDDMSGWINSYHAAFLEWDSSFKAFEMGETFEFDGVYYTPAVTIARTVPEPTTLLLLGIGLIGLAVTRRKL